MEDMSSAQSVPETLEGGLRILAGIIARDAVKRQFANRDELDPDCLPESSLQMEAIAERMPQRASLASQDGEAP